MPSDTFSDPSLRIPAPPLRIRPAPGFPWRFALRSARRPSLLDRLGPLQEASLAGLLALSRSWGAAELVLALTGV